MVRRAIVAIAGFIILAEPAFAIEAGPSVSPALAGQGWEELRFSEIPPNTFSAFGTDGVEILSIGSCSMLYRDVSADLDETPILAWRWRVDEAPPPTDLSKRGADDRALGVYVSFAYDPDNATLGEKMRRPFIEILDGENAPGRVIAYVWGGMASAGEVVESPHMGASGAMIVLRTSGTETETWFEERVNLVADYEKIFGATATPPVRIAITADSDDTGTRAHGYISGMAFMPRSDCDGDLPC